jgi:hypothetical protein
MSFEIVKNFMCARKLLKELGSPVLETEQSYLKEKICNTLK